MSNPNISSEEMQKSFEIINKMGTYYDNKIVGQKHLKLALLNFIRNFLFTDSNLNAMMGTGRHGKCPGITSRNDVREPCRAVFYGAAMTGLPLPRQYRFK